MSELFIELYSEEIPSKFSNSIKNEVDRVVRDAFVNYKLLKEIKDDYFMVYITPCRIVIYTNALTEEIIVNRRIVGPKLDANSEEINGFLKAFDLNSIGDLKEEDENYVLFQENFKINTKEVLKEVVLNILNSISSSFSQNIRWNSDIETKWASPLRNILCLFEGEVVDFEFCNLKSNNTTYGHKILAGLDKKIGIKDFKDYKAKMKENFVVFDQDEREKIIVSKILHIEQKFNVSIFKYHNENFKKELIQKIVNSTEYPDIFLGEFKQDLLKLPAAIIANIICGRYNCFCLIENSNNILTNKYILFADTKTTNNGKNIISGFNNVINNKLFSIDSELTKFLSESIETKMNKLKLIPYHRDFGTIYNKVERLIELSKFICLWIPHCDLITTEEAARLCKIDLTSNLVRLDNDLKGYLSAYYAKVNGYPENVCRGIKEYYEPKNLKDNIPETNVGRILSIAGRVDNIITLFIANEEATSSKDPYGIRKNVASVIKIIIEGHIQIPINILIHKSISLFRTNVYKRNQDSKISVKEQIINIENGVIELFKKRFISYLIDCGYNIEIINSVINSNVHILKKQPINLNIIYDKINKVSDYIENNREKFLKIKSIYKRLNNILVDFRIKDIRSILNKFFCKSYLKNEQEKIINTKIKEIKNKIKKYIKQRNYADCFDCLYEFHEVLDDYFKNNLIKTNSSRETNSRLFLLYKIKSIFDNCLNFSEIKSI